MSFSGLGFRDEGQKVPTDLDTFVGMLFRAGHKYTIDTRGLSTIVSLGRPIVSKDVPNQEVVFIFVGGKLLGP